MTAGPSHVPDVPSGPLPLAVCCRIKSARGHWITARAGLNGARPRRSATEVHCARSDPVRRPTRPARYGHGTGAGTGAQLPCAEIRNDHRPSPRAPNRAGVHPLESVKRLLHGRIDDIGVNLPRAWRNSISIEAGCHRFPVILPNSAGFVPGLAGNTMLPAYCLRDPSG